MKKCIFFSVLLVFTICSVYDQACAQGDWTGNVNVFYGLKKIDSDDWAIDTVDLNLDEERGDVTLLSVDKATEIGANVDFCEKSWPFSITFGIMEAKGDDIWSESEDVYFTEDNINLYDGTVRHRVKLEPWIQELRFGIKKIWDGSPAMRIYAAGGLAQISGKARSFVRYEEESPDLDWYYSASASDRESDSSVGLWISGGVYWTLSGFFNIGVEAGYSKGEITLEDKDYEAGGTHYGMFLGYHW